MIRKILTIICMVLQVGCATTYQGGLTGGPFHYVTVSKLEIIGFSGNGFIDGEKIQMFALNYCAEVAKNKKKPYFIMFENYTDAAIGKSVPIPTVTMFGSKPKAQVLVLFLDETRSGALRTEEVLTKLTNFIKS